MNDYIHAVFMVNQLFQYVDKNISYARKHSNIPTKVYEVLGLLQNPDSDMEFILLKGSKQFCLIQLKPNAQKFDPFMR